MVRGVGGWGWGGGGLRETDRQKENANSKTLILEDSSIALRPFGQKPYSQSSAYKHKNEYTRPAMNSKAERGHICTIHV